MLEQQNRLEQEYLAKRFNSKDRFYSSTVVFVGDTQGPYLSTLSGAAMHASNIIKLIVFCFADDTAKLAWAYFSASTRLARCE